MGNQFSSGFYATLTERQMAMLRVLFDQTGTMSGEEICREMRREYNVDIADGGLNGVIAGISKEYGEETVERMFRRRDRVDMGNYQTTYYMLSAECKDGWAEYAVNELDEERGGLQSASGHDVV